MVDLKIRSGHHTTEVCPSFDRSSKSALCATMMLTLLLVWQSDRFARYPSITFASFKSYLKVGKIHGKYGLSF